MAMDAAPGLSKDGRQRLNLALRPLKRISPWPGLLQLLLRLPLQLALWWLACSAWAGQQYGWFVAVIFVAAVCFASLVSLSHDALHHRLTGISWLDEGAGRLISWPIAWPIGAYKYVHLIHHRLSGSDLSDPERISPLAVEWQKSVWRRHLLRHQLWFAMFVFGAAGLAHKLLVEVAKRWQDPLIRRALITDAFGIAAVLGFMAVAAYFAQGWQGLLGFVLAWLIHERVVGVVHQFRNHMEHYGLWGSHGAALDTQYATARTINTNAFGRWFFNGLHRHADHHVAPVIPFYQLERAHEFIANAYRQEGFISVETNGYFSALREVLALMKDQFSVDGERTARLHKSRD